MRFQIVLALLVGAGLVAVAVVAVALASIRSNREAFGYDDPEAYL